WRRNCLHGRTKYRSCAGITAWNRTLGKGLCVVDVAIIKGRDPDGETLMTRSGGSRRSTGILARFSRSLPDFSAPATFVLVHDLVMTAVAVLAAFYIRFEQDGIVERLGYLWVVLPLF